MKSMSCAPILMRHFLNNHITTTKVEITLLFHVVKYEKEEMLQFQNCLANYLL